jgi:hypothetical protein
MGQPLAPYIANGFKRCICMILSKNSAIEIKWSQLNILDQTKQQLDNKHLNIEWLPMASEDCQEFEYLATG